MKEPNSVEIITYQNVVTLYCSQTNCQTTIISFFLTVYNKGKQHQLYLDLEFTITTTNEHNNFVATVYESANL